LPAGKATVGVSDHGGWAVLVSVSNGKLVDRRRVTLVEEGLPAIPHHVDAQLVPLDEGVALVERVRASAERCSRAALEALARDIEIEAIALRICPELPATIEERITNVRAQNNADWVMYREALAGAARALGWRVAWFAAKSVHADAAKALGMKSIDRLLRDTGKALGPPWQLDHKLAMAAAIAAAK
jgi:hypothetical protein